MSETEIALRALIAESTSATELAATITEEERVLLTQGLGLLNPSPWLRPELRCYGLDAHGYVKNCPLPPGGFGAYGLTLASDWQILQQVCVEEEQESTSVIAMPRRF